MTPDINVLVAASRSDHPHHRQALSWVKKTVSAGDVGGGLEILPMVAAGFLRLVTHPRVFVKPTPIREAVAFIDALLAAPSVEISELGREWTTLRQLCRDGKLAGNDIPDAWIAAAVKVNGGHLVTFDRGFTRLLSKNQLTVLVPAR